MSKRLVLVQSDKGGVGKSTTARLLGELYRAKGTDVLIVDGDGGVGQLTQFLGLRDTHGRLILDQGTAGVQPFTIHGTERDRDMLLDMLAQNTANVVLVDLPAASLSLLRNADVSLLAIAKEYDYEVTIVSLLTPYRASVRDVGRALEYAPEATHLIVRNLGFGEPDDFAIWDESSAKKEAIARKAHVVDLTPLKPRIAAALDNANMTYHAGVDAPLLGIADRSRLRTWIDANTATLYGVRGILGMTG
jgi:hypothetical protein